MAGVIMMRQARKQAWDSDGGITLRHHTSPLDVPL